jgi:hypothetical protein
LIYVDLKFYVHYSLRAGNYDPNINVLHVGPTRICLRCVIRFDV